MQSFLTRARAARPGVAVSVAVLLLYAGVLLAACAPDQPETPTGRRVWEGPTNTVASSGVVTYDRREIAQQVPLPRCIAVGDDRYEFTRVSPFEGGGVNPPGLNDTFYRLDRWRLWSRPGPLEGQPVLYVTIRGSTGIVAEYQAISSDQSCTA